MKKIKYLLFGIVSILGIGVSFGFYADLTSINPVGGSVYNVPYCFFADTVKIFNNGIRIDGISEGAYNTSITGFVSTNQNSFTWNAHPALFSNSYYGNNSFIIYNGKSFGFGTSYSNNISDYSVYIEPGSYGGIRLFFDTPIGSVGNNPLLNFNTNNLNSTGNLPVQGFEFFTPSFTRTNYGFIIDYGTQGKKGRHFGLDSWGYSYGINFSDDSSKISWDSFSFSSLGSEELLSSLKLGLSSFDHLTSNNILSLGILVLKNNGYDYNQGGQGKYLLLSKNPNSYSGLLYEIFDCNSYQGNDWLPNIMDSSRCTSLSHGTINGVLPFTDSGTQFDVGSLDGFLGYIFNTSELYGFSYFTDSTLSFNAFRYGGGCGGGYYDYCWGSIGDYTLSPDSSAPSIKEIYLANNNGGNNNGSNSPIVFDYNSLLINDMVICYITSGDVCSFNNFSRSGFENSFPVVSSYRNGSKGQLLMSSAQPYLTELCLNSNTINYAFCSQLDIYSGAFILFDYSNGELTYNILGDSFAVDVAVSNSGQLGSVGCYGSYCFNINVGATEYIINQDTGYYTGLFLSTGYYEDFLTLNKTGFFMKCPYSYDNQNVVVGKNLLSKLGGFDLFVPINCMIAGFNAGKSFTMIDWAGFKELGPIMKFTDDYDGNHKILFTFFDVLFSVAIVIILMKLYHLFK